jgi:hypothetical protein
MNCETNNCDHMGGVLAGAAIGAGVGIVLEYLSDTVNDKIAPRSYVISGISGRKPRHSKG